MAVLPNTDRAELTGDSARLASAERIDLGLTKADLRAAINAVDDWIDTNAASFNAALPLPARTTLTAKQKARLFFLVARRRFDVT